MPGPATVAVAAEEDGWWFAFTFAGRQHLTSIGDQQSERDPAAGCPASMVRLCRLRGIAIGEGRPAVQKASAAVSYLDQAVAPAMIAIGDAAMSLDPLSAGGVARALQTAKGAAQAIARAIDGDLQALADYERGRKRIVVDHVLQRSSFYARCRFASAAFWKKRSTTLARPDEGAS